MAQGTPPTRIVTTTSMTSNEFFTFGLLAKVAKQIPNSKNGKVGYLVVSFAVTRNKLIMLTDSSHENHRIERRFSFFQHEIGSAQQSKWCMDARALKYSTQIVDLGEDRAGGGSTTRRFGRRHPRPWHRKRRATRAES